MLWDIKSVDFVIKGLNFLVIIEYFFIGYCVLENVVFFVLVW